MTFIRVMTIFRNIDSDMYDEMQKAAAIYEVMNMPTHNSITKAEMLKALKWLWHRKYKTAEEQTCTNLL